MLTLTLRRLPWLALVCWLGLGCDSQKQQENFVDSANAPPAGFTRTDAGGQILTDDPDDWRTAPFYIGKIRVDPAYPNPSTSDFVNLPVTVLEFDAIGGRLTLRSFDDQRRGILLDEILDASSPGAYSFRFTPARLVTNGLHRVFIFDQFGEIISYGDLMVE